MHCCIEADMTVTDHDMYILIECTKQSVTRQVKLEHVHGHMKDIICHNFYGY